MKRALKLAAFLVLELMALNAAWAADPEIPTFYARRDYVGLRSLSVGVADTNGDGIPDLVANANGYIEVLFGNGNGNFRPGANSNVVVVGPSVLADLNGDGKVDLVQGGTGPGGNYPEGIGVSLGNGDGTFQYGVFYQVADNNFGYLVVADFNGDGIPDVAATGASGVWLFTGKGDGTLNPGELAVSLPMVAGREIVATDFNGDQKMDLVVALSGTNGEGNGFAVLLGNGNGTFQSPQTFAEPKQPEGLAVGLLTKEGHPSIALTAHGYAYLYFGNGAGGFSGPHYVELPNATNLAIGDLNGDGIPDLVSSSGYIDYGLGAGKFTNPVEYPVQADQGTYNVVLADLRNNGLTDIVTDAYFGISVLLNIGNGAYEDGVWTKVAGGAGCGAAADFNGDGKPDLAVNNAQGVSILLGTGKSGSPFTPGATLTLANAECLVTGDLNGDGIPDLLVPVTGSPNALLAYLGNGDGTFTLKSTTPTPNSGGYVVLGDFNHDGKLDFATSGNLLALGNGDGTFQTPAAFIANPPASGFSNIAVGDVNNDGWADLVLTNSSVLPTVNLFVMLNNQHCGFSQVPSNVGDVTIQVILADVNSDGNLDAILAGPYGGASVYLGNGGGEFTFKVTLGVGFSVPSINVVADLNGDGIPDIATLESDTLGIYLGEGEAKYATGFFIGTGPAPGSVLVENLHGQAASAGLSDIVAPDNSGGVMVLPNLTK